MKYDHSLSLNCMWQPTQHIWGLQRESSSHSHEPIHHRSHKVTLSPCISPSEGGRCIHNPFSSDWAHTITLSTSTVCSQWTAVDCQWDQMFSFLFLQCLYMFSYLIPQHVSGVCGPVVGRWPYTLLSSSSWLRNIPVSSLMFCLIGSACPQDKLSLVWIFHSIFEDNKLRHESQK